jgi:serine protease Do
MRKTLCLAILSVVLLGTVAQAQTTLQEGTVVAIQGESWGSGFVVGQTPTTWIIATARHCVEDANNGIRETVTVNGRISQVLATSETDDAALVAVPRISIDKCKVWDLGPLPKRGDSITALGNHYRLAKGLVYNDGLMEARGYVIMSNWIQEDETFINVAGPLFPGMSGGPVYDSKGRVIGVISRFPPVRGQMHTGMCLCVPISAIQELLNGEECECH